MADLIHDSFPDAIDGNPAVRGSDAVSAVNNNPWLLKDRQDNARAEGMEALKERMTGRHSYYNEMARTLAADPRKY